MTRLLSVALALVLLGAVADDADPYLWLEDVNGVRAMEWVRAENAKTLGVLEGDPHYAAAYADALKIVQSKERIPSPEFVGGQVYNFWQDADHVRGIWRRTTLAGYESAAPPWTTVLDLDAIAKSEKANWVWGGAGCRQPREDRCLIDLSDGGEDAKTLREYDPAARAFVPGGFSIPRGRQAATWESPDALLVSREWNPGDLTASAYPFIVKRLKRGQALSEATEIFRGSKSDTAVFPNVLEDGSGHKATLVVRYLTAFEREWYVVTPGGVRKLGLPPKSAITDMVAGRLLVKLDQDWTVGGTAFAQGSLVALDLDAVNADPEALKPALVYAPGERESIDGVVATKSRLILTTYANVRGRAFVYAPAAHDGWTSRKLDLPDNSSIDVVAASAHDDDAFLSVENFLTPKTIVLANAASGSVTTAKSGPAFFDASQEAVDQNEAISKDGTRIPYFIVHPKDMALDGNNPTILYGYGGFGASMTPFYSGLLGKLWLERGGVYVLANIRGGGEFGPAWHDAALTVHRQRAYDDFAAVAENLIALKVTSPRRLGIQGGSNGGLLMGVEFEQHPDLWNAVDIQVPLLDMLRYEQIAAGSSWVGEYGSVSNPEQRAFLASISPYQNIKPGVAYPEPFIWTTTKDDRVGPQHARKFAAKLSAMNVPYLFYEVTEGGHAAGANLTESAHTSALEYTYFIRKLMN